MNNRRVMLPAAVALLFLLLHSRVWADKKLAQEHFKKGMAAFTLEKYDKAIEEFTAGFENEPDPVFLFNIAQAYRLSNHAQEAIKFYQKYLKLAPHASNRRMVEEQIAALTKTLGPSHEPLPLTSERRSSNPAPGQPAEPAGNSTASIPATGTAGAARETTRPAQPLTAPQGRETRVVPPKALQPTPPPRSTPPRRWPVWVGVAAGVAAAGLGVGLGVGLTQSRPTELPLQDAR